MCCSLLLLFIFYIYLPFFSIRIPSDGYYVTFIQTTLIFTSIAPRAYSDCKSFAFAWLCQCVCVFFPLLLFRYSILDFAASAIITFVQNRNAVVWLQWQCISYSFSHFDWHVFISSQFYFTLDILFVFTFVNSFQHTQAQAQAQYKYKTETANRNLNSHLEWNHEAVYALQKRKTN